MTGYRGRGAGFDLEGRGASPSLTILGTACASSKAEAPEPSVNADRSIRNESRCANVS